MIILGSMAKNELILMIGVLISAAIILFELASIFTSQAKLTKEIVVADFAKELEGMVDKAAAATEDVNFTYSPEIKKYSVEIKNNLVVIKDKVSNGEANFFKLAPQIANNSFEDSELIHIVKRENRILIFADYQTKIFLG